MIQPLPLTRASLAPYLFNKLDQLAPWPASLVPVPQMVSGPAFFPGGSGLWPDAAASGLPDIMVVGQDFSTASEHAAMIAGHTHDLDSRTWKNFLPFAAEAGLSLSRCFFTNALMGLRKEGSSVGPNPGYRKRQAGFMQRSHDFLRLQVEVVNPKLILVLGMDAARVFAACSPDLADWTSCKYSQMDAADRAYVSKVSLGRVETACLAIVHPSYRHANLPLRRFRGHAGHHAELALLRHALAAVVAQIPDGGA